MSQYCPRHGYYESQTIPGCPTCHWDPVPQVVIPGRDIDYKRASELEAELTQVRADLEDATYELNRYRNGMEQSKMMVERCPSFRRTTAMSDPDTLDGYCLLPLGHEGECRFPEGGDRGGERCQNCGRAYEYVWWCSDQALWNEIIGGEGGLLCIDCFDRLARDHVGWIEWVPLNLRHLSLEQEEQNEQDTHGRPHRDCCGR